MHMQAKPVFFAAFLAAALLAAGCLVPQGRAGGNAAANQTALAKFQSWGEVSDFIKSASSGYSPYSFGLMRNDVLMATSGLGAVPKAASEDSSASQGFTDYSTTNIQVAGVDEADIIKNDGKYLYVASAGSGYYGYYYYGSTGQENGTVRIIDAYPASSMRVVSTITVDGTVGEIFIDGDKLVVFGTKRIPYEATPYPDSQAGQTAPSGAGIAAEANAKIAMPGRYYPYYSYTYQQFVRVYDVTDRSSPVQLKEIALDGSYVTSRMIGKKVYALVNQQAYYDRPVPLYYENGLKREVPLSAVSYVDCPDTWYQYAFFFTIDLDALSFEAAKSVVLLGGSQNVYVSAQNAYITSTEYSYSPTWDRYYPFLMPLAPELQANITAIDAQKISAWRKDKLKFSAYYEWLYSQPQEVRDSLETRIRSTAAEAVSSQFAPDFGTERTSIHRFSLGPSVEYQASGYVPGHALNQFSLDESGGYFRIATTSGRITSMGGNTSNDIYVLAPNLTVVGSLQGLAPGESIYSTRFIGSRAYLVTFKKVDPLFVIDLSAPTEPRLLGKLKIPGYSDYLHPYDEAHLIGIGKDAIPSETGDFSWYQGVKLSLFDVSDVASPREVASFKIGDRGTESEALSDHKAFLFSKAKSLLVVPITLAELDRSKYASTEQFQYGEFTFQGAYVFRLTAESGFELRGRISHANESDLLKAGEYFPSCTRVRRSAYIGDTLYTVSDSQLLASDLSSLVESGRVGLAQCSAEPYYVE
jgi:uncharacterized secreted protein with C-terminal beta-propeller domain